MKIINPKLEWQPVLKTNKTPFKYGDRGFRKYLHNEPAIYRLRLESPAGTIKQVYIGETATLRERVQRHKSRRKNDPYSLRKRFLKKGKIYLDTLEIEPFKINNKRYSTRSLRAESKRQLIENIMLYKALNQGYKILNKGWK